LVGRVLDVLDEIGLTKDTAVLYTSDNGFFHGEYHFFDKRLMYEPSLRVPLLIRYPRLITSGRTPEELALNVDLAPTILDLAGIPVPEEMDGVSLKKILEDRQFEWREDFLYEYFEYPAVHMVRKNRGVRTKRWKYIHFFEEPQEFELYDLENDPLEERNLYGDPQYADIVEELRRRMIELRRETNDPDLEK